MTVCRTLAVGLRRVGFAFVASAAVGVAFAQEVNNSCETALPIIDGLVNGEIAASGNAQGLPAESWFSYISPFNGTLIAATCGSDFDTTLAVFNGCKDADGVELAADDDGCTDGSLISMEVGAGQEFWIRVAGHGHAAGRFILNVETAPEDMGGISAAGPDVVLRDCTNTLNHGNIGGIRAYSLGSSTCNIGTSNLLWTNNSTPAYAMNLYRLKDGRLQQVGQSWCKMACCAAAGNGCGLSCNGAGGSVLGAGCLDVYSASWNSGQGRLGPRSGVNAFTGAFAPIPGGTGNAIFRRLQVNQTDLDAPLNPGAQYIIEGVYVGSDDAANGNSLNNATWKRVNLDGSTFNLTVTGAATQGESAVLGWRTLDPTVTTGMINVPSEGRFHYGYKVTDLGGGQWRYAYAIFNLNSDRSGGSLSVPKTANINISNVGFADVFYHSGEPYDNTNWTNSVSATEIRWASPQTFAQNPNSNALRWGTTYTFWFDANRPPVAGTLTLGLFKPHATPNVTFAGMVPEPPPVSMVGDLNCDGAVDNFDIDPFTLALTNAVLYDVTYPNCDRMNADVNNDGSVNNFDIDPFVDLLTGP